MPDHGIAIPSVHDPPFRLAAMTPTDATPSFTPLPLTMPVGTAAGDILLAACQRSIMLNAEFVEEVIRRTLGEARAPTAPAALMPGMPAMPVMPGLPPGWHQQALVEPGLRYVIGLMSLGRSTTDTLVALMTAQMRGASGEVETLSRNAHEDAIKAVQAATSATGAVMSQCLGAVGQFSHRGDPL